MGQTSKRNTWAGVVEDNIRKHAGPHGEHWYRVQMGRRGKGNRRSKVVMTLDAALALKREWLAGGLPPAQGEAADAPKDPDEETVAGALRLYALARPTIKDDIETTEGTLKRSYPDLLTLRVAVVGDDHFALYRRLREAAGLKVSGIGSQMGLLRAAIRYVRPTFHLSKGLLPRPDATRHKTLTETELKAGLLATPEPVRAMARLAVLTFMRQGEIRTLRRGQVDLHAGTLTLHKAKKGPRVVPLGVHACLLLREQMAGHAHDVVFPRHARRVGKSAGAAYSGSRVSHIWHQSMVLIGRPDFTFHDLRHHAAMTALANGASFPELQALGGWSRPDMVNRYATASNDRLRMLQDLSGSGPAARVLRDRARRRRSA